ncbi:hypothetical protein PST407_03395 [Pseudomonas syringae pv. tomato]|uniref:Uncharacterized protein n=1 Tax=Pseudomonas syringae pv. tomato TaxID=323 RepID=A0AAV1BJX9_PSEUB|nr:hypothetical protein PST407_03395 [Pseudomonas syringae pv. tomato]KUR50094.1 hypothetical protein PSTA9_00038 [Pseudomonas syringae pv. tomato]CAI8785227.1 hypothetical protein DAPPPG215_06505 [Pseudomonas syringae pv. tomato]
MDSISESALSGLTLARKLLLVVWLLRCSLVRSTVFFIPDRIPFAYPLSLND